VSSAGASSKGVRAETLDVFIWFRPQRGGRIRGVVGIWQSGTDFNEGGNNLAGGGT